MSDVIVGGATCEVGAFKRVGAGLGRSARLLSTTALVLLAGLAVSPAGAQTLPTLNADTAVPPGTNTSGTIIATAPGSTAAIDAKDDVNITGSALVGGDFGIAKSLAVTGASDLSSPKVENASDLIGATTVGDAAHASTLEVKGATTLDSTLNVVKDTTIGTSGAPGALEVTGTSTATPRSGPRRPWPI